jgi:N6-adenosine-specific RNA methylase IME4
MSHASLPALISRAERTLAAANNFDQVKRAHDEIEALRLFAEKIGADTRKLGELKIEAEARLGEEIHKAPKAKAGRHRQNRSHDATNSPTLKQRRITKSQSSRWQQVAAIPREQRREFYDNADEVTTSGLLKKTQPERKKARRREREAELAGKTRDASARLGTRLYDVILADPPWRFEPYSRDTGMDRAADNHYPTMPAEEIADVGVPAAPNSILFLWATAPMLLQALAVMAAWGFTYKSHCIWVKPKRAHGFWFWSKHELLLVGTRGNVPAPAPGEQWESVIATTAMGRHSEKPQHFAELIEEMFPNGTRLEMFARQQRLGWDVFGNEV